LLLRRVWIGATVLLVATACAALLSCAGISSATQKTNPPPPAGSGIPTTYWGLIVHRLKSYPLQFPYGQFRGWDSGGGQWPDIETCVAASGNPSDACFDWTHFDTQMAQLHQAGVKDVLYTLSRTPQWAVDLTSDPTGQSGTECDYYAAGTTDLPEAAGQCLTPIDLNADGSGANQMWKNWVTAMATRVNDPTYLQTHAHIKYWEPWNEFHRSATLINYVGQQSYEGTYAQMVRMTEDLRCIVTGKGVIHNYPAVGHVTSCSATPIDVSAMIVAPSSGPTGGLYATQNFLYCNGTGAHAAPANTQCTTGNAGSQAVDIINEHLYALFVTPETVAGKYIQGVRAILQPAELAKPFISGEGSWGSVNKPNVLWTDPYAQAGFIPRYFALNWSAGVTMNFWYGYDDIYIGGLYDPTTGQPLQPAAAAWTLTYNWLAGAKPTNSPFCSSTGTVYTCDFTEANGTIAELVWDAQYGQNCSQLANPIICGATVYNVPPQFNKDWIDLRGDVHAASGSITIGANPILLEGQ
jgi:hypothetical protein